MYPGRAPALDHACAGLADCGEAAVTPEEAAEHYTACSHCAWIRKRADAAERMWGLDRRRWIYALLLSDRDVLLGEFEALGLTEPDVTVHIASLEVEGLGIVTSTARNDRGRLEPAWALASDPWDGTYGGDVDTGP